jgi:hypothetical protein
MDKKKFIVSVAIAIIFALFVGYGIEVFDPSPDREDFCPERLYQIDNEEECLAADGEWSDGKGIPRPVEVEPAGFCDQGKKCYDDFNSLRTKHDKVVFIVAIIVGLLAVVAGITLKKDAISTGILSGGVLVILYGTIRYWRHANDILKFILLGIALAVLIYLAYMKLDKKK